MKRLRMALRCGHRFNFGANYVVENVLRRQRPTRCLAVCAQRKALLAFRVELLDELCPEEARSAKLCHLHEEIHADAEEEREARTDCVDLQAPRARGLDVRDRICKGVPELLRGGRAGLVDTTDPRVAALIEQRARTGQATEGFGHR